MVSPTGTGKTIMLASIIGRKDWGGRALVLAHREELIRQNADKISRVTGQECEIEMADERANANGDHGMFNRANTVVSTVQTQVAGKVARMKRFRPTDFGLIVIDECHHAPSPSYMKVLDHYRQNPRIKILGCTATPDRTDEAALGRVFDSAPFVYEISDAIRDGWLVPIRQKSVTVAGLDYSDARTTAGDLNMGDIAKAQRTEAVLHAMVSPIIEIAAGRKTVVFAVPGFMRSKDGETDGTDDPRVSERMTEIFNRHIPGCARRVSQDTPKDERRQMLADFRDGRYQFLVNVGILTEGWDEPTVECVAIARPTKSRSLYAQMIGRGTRPLPNLVDGVPWPQDRRRCIELSPKPYLDVIDLKGNAGRHKLIHAADVLGGNYDDEVVSRASKKADKTGRDLLDCLEESKSELAQERRKAVTAKAHYAIEEISPFDVFDIERPVERGWDSGKGISDNQRFLLERNGVNCTDMGRSQASAIIAEIKHRQASGLPSFKQAAAMRRRGVTGDTVASALNAMFGRKVPA